MSKWWRLLVVLAVPITFLYGADAPSPKERKHVTSLSSKIISLLLEALRSAGPSEWALAYEEISHAEKKAAKEKLRRKKEQ